MIEHEANSLNHGVGIRRQLALQNFPSECRESKEM